MHASPDAEMIADGNDGRAMSESSIGERIDVMVYTVQKVLYFMIVL